VNGGSVSGSAAASSCHSVTLIPREDLLPPRKRRLSQENDSEEPESQVNAFPLPSVGGLYSAKFFIPDPDLAFQKGSSGSGPQPLNKYRKEHISISSNTKYKTLPDRQR
jgi:hypothetical protein